MKNANKLFVFLALMLVFALLFSWLDGSLDNAFTTIVLICLSIGIGFTVTLGALLAIDVFKGSILFNEDRLIDESIRLIRKKFKTFGYLTVESQDGLKFYIIPSEAFDRPKDENE